MNLAKTTGLWLLITAILTVLPLDAQDTFGESTSVVVVEIPVRVEVDGLPLRGLTRDDFEVYDEGEQRELIGFEALDYGASTQGAVSAEVSGVSRAGLASGGRSFLFLFDLAYGAEDLVRARRRLEESVSAFSRTLAEGSLERDRVAIAYFSAVRGVKLVLGFSSDAGEIAKAIRVVELVVRSQPKQIEAEFAAWKALAPRRHGARAKTARGGLRPSLEDLMMEARQSGFRGDVNLPHSSLVMHMTRGLRLISRRARLAGEKHLVLLSAGPLFGGEEQARSQRFIQELFRDFRQENWSIEAVNTAGLGYGRPSLLYLARGTGGQLFTNSRDIGSLLEDMLEKTSVSYVLAFQVVDPPAAGTYRELSVKLKSPPAKTRIIHRPGYYVGRARARIPGIEARN